MAWTGRQLNQCIKESTGILPYKQWASCWSALPDRLPIVVEDLPFVVMN